MAEGQKICDATCGQRRAYRADCAAVQGIGALVGGLLLLLGWYGDRAVAEAFRAPFSQPFRMLLVLMIAFLDLLIRSPLRAGQAAFYRDWQIGRQRRAWHIFSAFRAAEFGKSVSLRLQIWWRGFWLWAVLCSPAACLLALSDRLCRGGLFTAPEQVAYFLVTIAAWGFLITGALLVWLWRLRYMPAWYLLGEARSAGEAMRCARRMMRGHIGEAVCLYGRFVWMPFTWLLIVPYFFTAPRFYASCAAFAEERSRSFAESDVYFAAHRKNC